MIIECGAVPKSGGRVTQSGGMDATCEYSDCVFIVRSRLLLSGCVLPQWCSKPNGGEGEKDTSQGVGQVAKHNSKSR